MRRLAMLAGALLLAGCAAAPAPKRGATLPVVEPVHGARVVYVPVETTPDDLRECLAARRAEAVKKSQWRQYAERLERLLGIGGGDTHAQ